jgi:MYXO-CTERM domain-containing protein
MTARPHALVVPALVSFVAVALAGTPALADVISNEEGACQQKAAGDACDLDGKAGKCTKSTCGRNDYSDGVPPKSIQVECLLCEPAKDEPTEVPAKTDAKATTVEPTKTAGEAKNTEVPKTKGCANASIGEPSTAIGSAVLGIVLLGLGWRRRRPAP